jgi:hypothetical protein
MSGRLAGFVAPTIEPHEKRVLLDPKLPSIRLKSHSRHRRARPCTISRDVVAAPKRNDDANGRQAGYPASARGVRPLDSTRD